MDNRTSILRRLLWLLVGIGFAGALFGVAARRKVETRNRSVEIALDYNELRALAGAEGKSVGQVLRRFKQAGATTVILQEETIGALEDAHLLTLSTAPYLSVPRRNVTSVSEADADTTQRVVDALQAKTHWKVTTPIPSDIHASSSFLVGEPYPFVRGVGIGLDPDAAREIRGAGLRIVGRVSNYNGVEPKGIAWSIRQMKAVGVSTVLFSGDEVLGFKGYVLPDVYQSGDVSTAEYIRDNALNYATVEFGKQKGDAELAKFLQERTVRLHTILGSEMVTADIPSNIQRFKLAARERNIRVLFVRLFLGERDPLETNAGYVEKIADGMTAGGLLVGAAHGYAPLSAPLWVRGLVGLALAAATLLLWDSFTGGLVSAGSTSPFIRLILFGGAALLALLPVLPVGGTMGVKLAALAVACVYPSLALLHSDKLRVERGMARSPLQVAFIRFAVTSGITFLGIASVVALLADRVFLIKSDVFAGIKGSQLIPVLIVALVYGLSLYATRERPWKEAVREAWADLRRWANEPLRLWQIGAALFALVILVLLVARSGNDPGVGVSAFELKTRALLDRFMPARPRFKEFLFGHPALLLAFVVAARGYRKAAVPLLIIGAIGQVGLLNTFCHLHTPLAASLARALLGVFFGLLIGLILYLPLDRLLLRRLPPPAVSVVRHD